MQRQLLAFYKVAKQHDNAPFNCFILSIQTEMQQVNILYPTVAWNEWIANVHHFRQM